MKVTLNEFILWMRQHPEWATYQTEDNTCCPMANFVKERRGAKEVEAGVTLVTILSTPPPYSSVEFPGGLYEALAFSDDRTYGAAIKRLERLR